MRVEMDNDSNCLDCFQLLFTHDVYQLIIRETKRFEHQKRQLEDNSLGDIHDFTLPELKAWAHIGNGSCQKKQFESLLVN